MFGRRPVARLVLDLAAVSLVCSAWACAGTDETSSTSPGADRRPGFATSATDCRREGVAFSPYRDGQDPGTGVHPTLAEISADLGQLRQITCSIRTYRSGVQFGQAATEAARLGFAVTVGVYIGPDAAINEAEIAAATDLARAGVIESVVVGNETQLSGSVSEEVLLGYIARVKAAVPSNVRVTTAEPWSTWLSRPQLAAAVDYILVHIHPFWEGVVGANASDFVVSRYQEVASRYAGQVVEIGETGWPSDGTPEDAGVPSHVVPSAENERLFIEEFREAAARLGIRYFLHEAHDQEFKWSEAVRTQGAADPSLPLDRNLSGHYPGSSWGLFRSDGQLKPALAALYGDVPGSSSRAERTIFDERGLATLFDMGVDSSQHQRGWLQTTDDGMRMAYPAGQAWGAVFVTVGESRDPPRPWKDFSHFGSLCIELRGEHGGEVVRVGMKDATDRDDGSESKATVRDLSGTWETYCFPLGAFTTANLETIYCPVEFVFEGALAQTVRFRRVRFVP